jgi:hypothetical protein
MKPQAEAVIEAVQEPHASAELATKRDINDLRKKI